MQKGKPNGFSMFMCIVFIAFMLSTCSGGGSYGGSSSDNTIYKCNMCGKVISKSQSIRTHGYCSSCAKTLQDYLDTKK